MPPNVRAYALRTSCFAADSIDIALATGSPLSSGASYSLQICEAGTSTPYGAATPLAEADTPWFLFRVRPAGCARPASAGNLGARHVPRRRYT